MAEVECYTAAQIKGALPTRFELLQRLADSFVALSHGRIVLGNPSHLQFEGQEADCCIKSAYKIGATVRACLSLTRVLASRVPDVLCLIPYLPLPLSLYRRRGWSRWPLAGTVTRIAACRPPSG